VPQEEQQMTRFAHSTLAFAIVGGLGAVSAGCGPTYPNCDNDEQCHEGEFCVNGHCEDCRDDSHCPVGQQCDSGACVPIPGWCNSDSMCRSDEMCDLATNRCVPRPIATATPCGNGTIDPGEECDDGNRNSGDGCAADCRNEGCSLEPAYFGYDEDTLDRTATAALERDRACFTERGYGGLQITGMADPRGTEEYNLALGERRARAVRDHLDRLGVPRRAMSTRSVGEEMATGADEASWVRDRRADVAPR
jgi:peptidoglycan-associated lipoprotein